MKETFKVDFEKAMNKLNEAQMEANVIANKVFESIPNGTFIVPQTELYTNSNIYNDLCLINEIMKEEDGSMYVRTEYDECIEIRELDDKWYNDVVIYLIEHL